MQPKDLVLNFYDSDVLLNRNEVDKLLHDDATIDWNSSKGFIEMNRQDILNLTDDLNKAYIRSKIQISHIIEEENKVCVRYTHFVRTIENPSEEMLLANFFVIWEIKNNKLFKGFQMSNFW